MYRKKKDEKPRRTQVDSVAIVSVEETQDTALATRQAQQITSLETLLTPMDLSKDAVNGLPNRLLQLTALENASWAYVARDLQLIRDTGVWEQTEDGAYKGKWDAFLEHYTTGKDFSAARVSNLIGYYKWFEGNYQRMIEARPEDASYDTPRIPREKTMRFVMQYQKAFEQSEKLLALVFWYEMSDQDTLRAEIEGIMGDVYVAAQEGRRDRSKKLGGTLTRPTFGPASRGGRDTSEIAAYALTLVAERAESLVCAHNAYLAANSQQREQVGGHLQKVLEAVIEVDEGQKKGD